VNYYAEVTEDLINLGGANIANKLAQTFAAFRNFLHSQDRLEGIPLVFKVMNEEEAQKGVVRAQLM